MGKAIGLFIVGFFVLLILAQCDQRHAVQQSQTRALVAPYQGCAAPNGRA